MDDDVVASSTPPFLTESLEMAMEVENENSKPPCFSCAFDNQNGGRSFSAESYLASGSLKRYGIFLSYKYNTLLRCSFHWCLVLVNADKDFQISLFFSFYRPHINLVAYQSGNAALNSVLGPAPSFVNVLLRYCK